MPKEIQSPCSGGSEEFPMKAKGMFRRYTVLDFPRKLTEEDCVLYGFIIHGGHRRSIQLQHQGYAWPAIGGHFEGSHVQSAKL
jgi:hypothetical protein